MKLQIVTHRVPQIERERERARETKQAWESLIEPEPKAKGQSQREREVAGHFAINVWKYMKEGRWVKITRESEREKESNEMETAMEEATEQEWTRRSLWKGKKKRERGRRRATPLAPGDQPNS